MQQRWTATSKSGKIYIGDPCYVMKDSIYDEIWGHQHNYENGEFEYEGETFVVGGTAYGDGTYHGDDGTDFPVDAGVLGAVPIEFIDQEKLSGWKRSKPGLMVDANEVILEYDDEGIFYFKKANGDSITFISTLYEDEEEEEDDSIEYCSDCGRHIGQDHDGGLCQYCEEADDYNNMEDED